MSLSKFCSPSCQSDSKKLGLNTTSSNPLTWKKCNASVDELTKQHSENPLMQFEFSTNEICRVSESMAMDILHYDLAGPMWVHTVNKASVRLPKRVGETCYV